MVTPFFIGLHQLPLDYYRYTHAALLGLCHDRGLVPRRLEAVYAPCYLLRLTAMAAEPSGAVSRVAAVAARLGVRAFCRVSGRREPIVVAADAAWQFQAKGLSKTPIGYHMLVERPVAGGEA
jgi:hypothetical protein